MGTDTKDTAGRPLLFTPDGRRADIAVREPVAYEIDGRSLRFVQSIDEIYEIANQCHEQGGHVMFVQPFPAPGSRPDASGNIQAAAGVVDQVSLAHIGLIWMLLQKAWQRIVVLENRLDERDREEGRDIGP